MADESEASPQEVVENYLGLGPFFKRHQDHILDKLEECAEIAEKAKKNKDMIFFAESLPIIDGLIQVGTTREEYKNAIRWVSEQEEWKEVEPAHVISALTFLYVANRGTEIANGLRKGGKPRDPKVWGEISRRVERLNPSESS